jgi:hypothetical protein
METYAFNQAPKGSGGDYEEDDDDHETGAQNMNFLATQVESCYVCLFVCFVTHNLVVWFVFFVSICSHPHHFAHVQAGNYDEGAYHGGHQSDEDQEDTDSADDEDPFQSFITGNNPFSGFTFSQPGMFALLVCLRIIVGVL